MIFSSPGGLIRLTVSFRIFMRGQDQKRKEAQGGKERLIWQHKGVMIKQRLNYSK